MNGKPLLHGGVQGLEMACTTWSRLRGLLGREDFGGVLLIVPCRDIHTFGMKRPIDVAFVSANGTVIESFRNVAPRRRLKNRRAAATLERVSVDAPWYSPGERICRVPTAEEADCTRLPRSP